MTAPQYTFPPPPTSALPTADGELFPVRRVYCVGRNYADHALEMGHDPDREPPFFFQKNPQDLVVDGLFPYPARSQDVHHELELFVFLQQGGRQIDEEEALGCVWGYSLGLDMTCRDIQAEAKAKGRPWIDAKAFPRSAPVGMLQSASAIGHPTSGALELRVNGELRQRGDLNQQIWTVPEIIANLSQRFELAAGDVVMTGTPSGVGPVQRGDRIDGLIEGVGELVVTVTE